MILTIVNVFYVLIAVAMIVLILMQRGAGAQAGSGFGAGASATVFGAKGSANFLSSMTKWLAVLFFAISLGMAWNASRSVRGLDTPAEEDIGIMGQAPAAAPAVPEGQAPSALIPDASIPGAPAPIAVPAPGDAVIPAAPEAGDAAPAAPVETPVEAPAVESEQPTAPVEQGSQGG